MPILFAALPGTIEQIRQGRVRALALTSAKRANAAPDIPTVGESGVPGYEATSWYGILAPVHTPARVITRLNAVVLDALNSQAVHDAFIRLGMDPLNTTPREFDAYLRSEIAKWTLVVREAGIRPD